MIDGWTIYWITRLDAIYGALVIVLMLLLLCMPFVGAVMHKDRYEEPNQERREAANKRLVKWLGMFCCAFVFVGAILTLTPTTKEAIAIYAIPKITNNEDVQQIPANFAKLINGKLQEWMQDVDILPKQPANGK